MLTEQTYYLDSYLKELTTKVLKVYKDADKKYRVILEKTIFYPMGGGQPTDQGVLEFNGSKANVVQVQMNQGEIYHFIESKEPLNENMNVKCILNWNRRYKNMQVHSAGHIIDFALIKIHYVPGKLQPQKGDHGEKPFIIYTGKFDLRDRDLLKSTIDDIITSNLKFSTKFVSFEELEKETVYLQPGLPTNKSLRMLTLEGFGSVADGGTQVSNTSEVGKIDITDIIMDNDTVEIRYQVT